MSHIEYVETVLMEDWLDNYAASEHLNGYWNVVSAPTDDEWPKTLTEDADTLFLNDKLAVTQNRVEVLIDDWHNAQLMLAGGDKMQRDLRLQSVPSPVLQQCERTETNKSQIYLFC